MKVQSKGNNNFAALDDSTAGEGLAIFFSQSEGDVTRWRIDVYARTNAGRDMLVGFFFVSPPSATSPSGETTRQVAAAVCPGAKTWSAVASPADGTQAATQESADITLISSKCCTAPVGVTRVGERYGYLSGVAIGPVVRTMLAGQTITKIIAHSTGAGQIQLGSGAAITVVTGSDIILEPKAPVSPGTGITLTNVNYVIEYLESA